jgi:hypothetical protein
MAIYLALIHFCGNASLFSGIKAHPEILYLGLPIYFVVGTVWGIIKWALYVKRRAVEYKEERQSWLLYKGVEDADLDSPVPDNLKKEWQNRQRLETKPMARNNKSRILTWMGFWPVSVIWSVIDEPWRYIYDAVHNLLQKISDRIYADTGFDSDMKPILLKKSIEFPGTSEAGDWNSHINDPRIPRGGGGGA